MSQKFSLMQSGHFVRQALTGYMRPGSRYRLITDVVKALAKGRIVLEMFVGDFALAAHFCWWGFQRDCCQKVKVSPAAVMLLCGKCI
jgi:hypothetical protein